MTNEATQAAEFRSYGQLSAADDAIWDAMLPLRVAQIHAGPRYSAEFERIGADLLRISREIGKEMMERK